MNSHLLGRAATGGEVAREGLGYQDMYVLSRLPEWLSQGAFSGVISECIGDVEVCYFTMHGQRRTFIEAKNYKLTPKKFWAEIKDFQNVHTGNETVYTQFLYVAPELPTDLSPIFRQLQRIRNHGASFELGASPLVAAEADFVQSVVDAGETPSLARFVLEHVDFDLFDDTQAESRCLGALPNALPPFDEFASAKQKAVLAKWKELVTSSTKRRIDRREFEQAILDALPEAEAKYWLNYPTTIHLQKGAQGEKAPGPFDISINVAPFLGEDRGARTSQEWDELSAAVEGMGEFIRNSRPRNMIQVGAELRMSLATLLGVSLKAAKGHYLEIIYRDNIFPLHRFDRAPVAYFSREECTGSGRDGVVLIHIGAATRNDLKEVMDQHMLSAAPRLYLESASPIPDIATLNTAVAAAKSALATFRSNGEVHLLHVFIKAPSFFAMALGHRLNALGEVQLYDWVGSAYLPTVKVLT